MTYVVVKNFNMMKFLIVMQLLLSDTITNMVKTIVQPITVIKIFKIFMQYLLIYSNIFKRYKIVIIIGKMMVI